MEAFLCMTLPPVRLGDKVNRYIEEEDLLLGG